VNSNFGDRLPSLSLPSGPGRQIETLDLGRGAGQSIRAGNGSRALALRDSFPNLRLGLKFSCFQGLVKRKMSPIWVRLDAAPLL
jgi:hypothetical protein